MLKKLLLISTVFLFTPFSQAFMHMEVGIGYNRGHYQTSKLQGLGLTTKLGFDIGSFFILADVGYHDLQLGSTPTSTFSDMGITLGKDFKAWKVWYTHLVSADLTIETTSSTTELSGDGIKLGIGGKVASSAYLNLEARFVDFTESNGTLVKQFLDSGFLSLSWDIW